MDLVTLTIATDKIEFRCNSELTEAERTSAVERFTRLAKDYPEIVRMYVDVECSADSDDPASFVAKGQIELGGPDLLASVANGDASKCIEFLLENFDRQLRRRTHRRARISLRAPKTPPPSHG
jgi:putative sigma-54 modulation protein